jgi:predicted phosphodiesterase
MTMRAAPTPDFPDRVCDLALPANARDIRVAGQRVPARPKRVGRIALLGDTGCRLLGRRAQACNDPVAWPFARVAAAVARARPDLIVHVGDYYYRETACPAGDAACAQSPYGDRRPSWRADWFVPAAPLFAAAPVVLVRGNHESCERGGRGWFRYLDAGTTTACVARSAPYAVALDAALRLVVYDGADANDMRAADVPAYASALAAADRLASPSRSETWFVTHRPPYLNATLAAASRGGGLGPFAAVLAGHVHAFSAISVAGGPPLVINGMGGDLLDGPGDLGASPLTLRLAARLVGAPRVRSVIEERHFGFALYERTSPGWTISLRDPQDRLIRRCRLVARDVACP